MSREFYIPSGYIEFKPNIGDYPKNMFACWVSKDKPIAMFFVGKQSKPIWHYTFKDNFAMKDKIIAQISTLMTRHEKKLEKRQAKKTPTTLQEGDILYTSWGYDQTNVDWYQITKKISPNMVEIRRIYGQATQDALGDRGETLPLKDHFIEDAEPIKKRISGDNSVNIATYARAWDWDGKSKYYSTYA